VTLRVDPANRREAPLAKELQALRDKEFDLASAEVQISRSR
jgi:hypothetical protein